MGLATDDGGGGDCGGDQPITSSSEPPGQGGPTLEGGVSGNGGSEGGYSGSGTGGSSGGGNSNPASINAIWSGVGAVGDNNTAAKGALSTTSQNTTSRQTVVEITNGSSTSGKGVGTNTNIDKVYYTYTFPEPIVVKPAVVTGGMPSATSSPPTTKSQVAKKSVGLSFDINKAVSILNLRAHKTWETAEGKCAFFVRMALEGGGY